MHPSKKFSSIASFEQAKRASEYEAMSAVIAMKSSPGSFINEADDDLVGYLEMQPLWLVRQLASNWLNRYQGKGIYPRYENVAPLVAGLLAARRSVRRIDKGASNHMSVEWSF